MAVRWVAVRSYSVVSCLCSVLSVSVYYEQTADWVPDRVDGGASRASQSMLLCCVASCVVCGGYRG